MRRLGLLTTLALLVGTPGFSQTAANGGDLPSSFRFSTTVDAVHLNVSVVKKGRLITDLEREDFRVLEDEVIQDITYFSRGTDSPVDVVVLVDASGSMDLTEKALNARQAGVQMIHRLGPEDRVSVYAFDRNLMKLCAFTQDKRVAIQALTALEPFGSTAIYDAVASVSDAVEHEGFGRRAIVLITDGVDTSSETTVKEALAKAKGVDLPVYAVRVLSPVDDPNHELFLGVHGQRFIGEDALRSFTAETGGRLFEGSRPADLVVASQKIREELKTQYRIGYVPSKQGGDEFRRIEVVTRRRGVEVRTRKGYYPKKRKDSSLARPAPQSFLPSQQEPS